LEYKIVPKKTILLHEGEMCNFEAFVIKGCVRKYYIDANGFEVILQFAIENAWISDISFSIYEDKPSRVYIETLEDCEFFMFSPETKEALFTNTISKSATEKYLEFLEHYPTLSQRVAQHYIASYLGISAEFLSKIRTKIAKH
jgi:CRP-like cAMP-binding protein